MSFEEPHFRKNYELENFMAAKKLLAERDSLRQALEALADKMGERCGDPLPE